jgi:hypothetical protein
MEGARIDTPNTDIYLRCTGEDALSHEQDANVYVSMSLLSAGHQHMERIIG